MTGGYVAVGQVRIVCHRRTAGMTCDLGGLCDVERFQVVPCVLFVFRKHRKTLSSPELWSRSPMLRQSGVRQLDLRPYIGLNAWLYS